MTRSATFALHPTAAPLHAEISYFDATYSSRVLQPVPNIEQSLSNPVYRQFLTFNPTPQQIGSVVASSPGGIAPACLL